MTFDWAKNAKRAGRVAVGTRLDQIAGVEEADKFTVVFHLFAYNSDLKGYHPNSLTPFDSMMNVDV